VGGECAAAPIENPHQRPCRPCPRMTRIHANKTMANRLLYSSQFATIRGQNFRFPLPLNAPSALRECGRRCAPETWGISAICPYPGERSGRRMRSSAYRKPTSAAMPPLPANLRESTRIKPWQISFCIFLNSRLFASFAGRISTSPKRPGGSAGVRTASSGALEKSHGRF
jgi:hypothetical protein